MRSRRREPCLESDRGAGALDRFQDDRGSVTAEFAMILPALALVIGLAVTAAQCGVVQVRLADAASDAARLMGRGEFARAAARVASAQPGASMSVDRDGVLVCVTASAAPSLVGGFDWEPLLQATGCALDDTVLPD